MTQSSTRVRIPLGSPLSQWPHPKVVTRIKTVRKSANCQQYCQHVHPFPSLSVDIHTLSTYVVISAFFYVCGSIQLSRQRRDCSVAMRGALFLFNEETQEYCDKLIRAAIAIQIGNHRMNTLPVGEQRTKSAEALGERTLWFNEQFD